MNEKIFDLIKGWKYEKDIKKDLMFLKNKNPNQFIKFNDYIEAEHNKGGLLIQSSLYGSKHKNINYSGLLKEYFQKEYIDLGKSLQMRDFLEKESL